MKTKLIPLFLLFMLSSSLFAQKENTLLRQGNKQYNKGDYKEAEKDYRKALEINKESVKGKFNLGTAIYQEKNFEESAKLYGDLAGKNQDRDIQAGIYHNMGNSFLEAKQYDKSILAYKNALMNNPSDIDTKYNLEYAKMMLKKQQEQQKKDQDKQNKDKQDKKKDKQDQKKDQQKQDQKNQPPQDQKKLSKEDAARMLEALKNDEKKTMQKVKKEKAKVQVVGIEKDW
ncbi:MAG: tetratricopeptide repeat protein [Bacteroidota bacterium]